MIHIAEFTYFLMHGVVIVAPYLIIGLGVAGVAGVAVYCMRPVYVRTDDEKNKDNNPENKD